MLSVGKVGIGNSLAKFRRSRLDNLAWLSRLSLDVEPVKRFWLSLIR
jgi:hypothetical protein